MPEIYGRLLARANEIYALKKCSPKSLPYMSPEMIPKIESRQVLALLEAVAEELERAGYDAASSPRDADPHRKEGS